MVNADPVCSNGPVHCAQGNRVKEVRDKGLKC
jgi:hypothetical protein